MIGLAKHVFKNSYLLKVLARKYGFLGTLQVIREDILFDVVNRVDTVMPIHHDDLFEAGERENRQKYAPTPFSALRQVMQLVIAERGYCPRLFVDYGSGKGKVLIEAARHDFKTIIGVEYSQELHDIAERNMQKLGLAERVTLAHADARELDVSLDDSLLYFFNPFKGDILDGCLRNIKEHTNDPTSVDLLYANPNDEAVFDRHFH